MNPARIAWYAVLTALFVTVSSLAQQPAQPVPMDPNILYGRLDNGLTYYIRHNEEPKERASFYIIQNVGALLEEDEQNGLAHFLEHMAFNGTEHFPGKGIINTLEKHGIAFGRNINAYTAYNETVYNITNVPIQEDGLLDTCLLILKDWSDYLLLTEEEIDAERGVITEEWRTRRNAALRMREQYFPVLLQGSKFAVRDVIGPLDIIQNFEYEAIRQFYRDWYRTDLQAIAVVGDFDAKAVEQKVIERFSEIKPTENPKERGFYPVPEHSEPRFCLATDKEASYNTVSLYIKHKGVDPDHKNTDYLREGYIQSLFNAMTSNRITELLQKGDPPFIAGGIQYSGFVRGYDVFILQATANPNEEEKALQAIYTEAERIRRHGFAPGELERAKTNMLTNWDIRFKERDKITHDRHAQNMQEHFLAKEPLASIHYAYDHVKKVLPTITSEEVFSRARRWMGKDNRVLVVTGSADPNTTHLGEKQAFDIVDDVHLASIDPYEDAVAGESLIGQTPAGGRIVSEKPLKAFDAVEWTLENGVRVIYRHADYEKDSVSLRAFSLGGASLVDNARVPESMMLEVFASAYGAGEFDNVALKKLLTGKKASCSVSLGEVTESLMGSCTPKDFETMMQLLYLLFERPRFDEEAHDALMARYQAFVVTLKNNPQKMIQDHLTRILSDHHPRARILNEDLLSDIDFAEIKQIYRDRFVDAEDFCFIIVGNIDVGTVRPMVETYIGSLTSTERSETFVDHKVHPPKGKTVKEIEIPLAVPKATIVVDVRREMDYTAYNRVCLRVIEGILDIRYVETIREEEGGSYGVSANLSLEKNPAPMASASFRFDCDPNKAAHLKTLLYAELDSIAKEGPSQENLDKAISNILKNRQEAKQHNRYWLSTLYGYYYTGINSDDPANFEDILKRLSTDDVKAVAARLFLKGDVVDVSFKPKGQ